MKPTDPEVIVEERFKIRKVLGVYREMNEYAEKASITFRQEFVKMTMNFVKYMSESDFEELNKRWCVRLCDRYN